MRGRGTLAPMSPATFAEHFELVDSTRRSFDVKPERDPQVYVDLADDSHLSRVWTTLGGETPQLLVRGDYGTGKSQLLRHIEYSSAQRRMRPVYVALGGLDARYAILTLHTRVMSVLDRVLFECLPKVADMGAWLAAQRLDVDVENAFRRLRATPRETIARSWLSGVGPTPTQARNAGFRGKLFEQAGPVELVRIWKAIARLHSDVDHKLLLILIDEAEAFSKIGEAGAAGIGQALRELFDQDNAAMGCVVGVHLADSRDTSFHPALARSDFQTRIAGRSIQLRPLQSPKRIQMFVTELWRQLHGSASPTLFSEADLATFGANFEALETTALGKQTGPITQRRVVNLLAHIGHYGYALGNEPPISMQTISQACQVQRASG